MWTFDIDTVTVFKIRLTCWCEHLKIYLWVHNSRKLKRRSTHVWEIRIFLSFFISKHGLSIHSPTSLLRLVAWMAHRPPTASLSSLRDALLEAMGDPQSPALRWGLRCGMDLEIAATWIGRTKVVGQLAPWSSKKQLAQCTFMIIFVYDAVEGKENLYKHRFTPWKQTSGFYSVVVSKSATSWVGTFIGSSGP